MMYREAAHSFLQDKSISKSQLPKALGQAKKAKEESGGFSNPFKSISRAEAFKSRHTIKHSNLPMTQ